MTKLSNKALRDILTASLEDWKHLCADSPLSLIAMICDELKLLGVKNVESVGKCLYRYNKKIVAIKIKKEKCANSLPGLGYAYSVDSYKFFK